MQMVKDRSARIVNARRLNETSHFFIQAGSSASAGPDFRRIAHLIRAGAGA
jgi:hypothetical protein